MSNSINLPLFQFALGLAVVYGDKMARAFLLDITRFFLYVHCKFALWIFTFFASSMEKGIYTEVTNIFKTLPYAFDPHFKMHPNLYDLFGWLIVIYSLSLIIYRCVVISVKSSN
jgi:hypothetical protein